MFREFDGNESLGLAPWELARFRLWSLLDLQTVEVAALAFGISGLNRVRVVAGMAAHHPDFAEAIIDGLGLPLRSGHVRKIIEAAVAPQVHRELAAALTDLTHVFEHVPLSPVLRSSLERVRSAIEQEPNAHTTEILVGEFWFNLLSELQEPLFFYVQPQFRALYEQSEPPFGDAVEAAFPEAVRDIAAAGRCLALDEWTASVFHSMRVLEHALHVFAVHIGIASQSPIELENWKNILDKIEAEIRKFEQLPKSAAKSEKTKLYSQAVSQFRYFKDAWRNHVSHSREHYDSRDAEIVWSHLRDFMQALVVVIA